MVSPCKHRRALTLLELTVVTVLLAIFAAVAIARLGPGGRGYLEVETWARRLAGDLVQARQRTIASGDRHYLDFSTTGGVTTGYVVRRRTTGGDVSVDDPREFPGGISVSVSHPQAGFSFDGSALAAYEFRLTSAGYTCLVSVIPATGTVRLTQAGG